MFAEVAPCYVASTMKEPSLGDILQLGVAERIQLVEDVWDSIAAVPESVPLTQEQRLELDRRLEQYRRSPETSIPWDEVRKRILGLT